MSRKRHDQDTDASPAPARALTSNSALMFLGVIILLGAAVTALTGEWLEALALFPLGIVVIGAATSIFGHGSWQTRAGVTLALFSAALFAFLVIRDATA